MRTFLSSRTPRSGYALMLVLLFSGIGFMVLTGALFWTSQNAMLSDRNNQYYRSVAAAEAATEKVLSQITRDYKNGGESTVYANLAVYQNMKPTSSEDSTWGDFQFNDASGNTDKTFLSRLTTESYVDLESQYRGLRGFASSYRVVSNARRVNSPHAVSAAVQQDVQVASIPIFQFAVFYGMDLEMNTMTTMDVRGRVHCNSTIYTYPSAPLTFYDDVTSAGTIIKTRKPGDPAYSSAPPSGTIAYNGQKDTNTTTLNLPIGTNNTPDSVRAVIQIPPSTESLSSPLGKQRYFNKAELLILVNNSSVTVAAKIPYATSSNNIPWSQASYFVSTNQTFTDQREGKTIKVTELDIAKFNVWTATNSGVAAALGAGTSANLIYVSDQRSSSSSTMPGVRLINGQTLSARGLTVATENPLYVKGHFNCPNGSHLGTTNTTSAKPSSLVSDALSLLSSSWNDSSSSGSYSSRVAANTTVNAAILTGIVPTTNNPAKYSGGVHNLGRFLENWSGKTITVNGSMVVLFNSIKGDKPFQQPGAYYYPPSRKFAFDLNYQDITKQPPGTPELRALIRSKWLNPPINKTDYIASTVY